MKKINLDKAFWFVGSILTIFAFQLKLDLASDGTVVSFAKSFREYSITPVFLVPILFLFYKFVSQTNELKKDKNKFFCLLPAVLFSFFMVMGYSYEKTNSWDLVINTSNFQWLKALIAFSGYTIFFYYCINFMFYKIDSCNLFSESQGKQIKIIERYFKYLKQKPFITSFITLLIIYIPYIIASYPAIFMGDTPSQIVQAYPECGQFSPPYTKNFVLEEGNYLNNHHPIMHTLLMHSLIYGGGIFSSYNIGIFIYALLQLVFMLVAVAYLISFLIEIGVSEKWVCLVLLYYFCSRRIQNYMFVVIKDVIFSAFVLIFIVSMIRIFFTGKRRYYLLFGISMLGIILFRNDGRYMLIVSFVIIAILNRQFRRCLLACAVLVSLFGAVYSNIVLPTFHIMPGSTREMLSVPFQHTARYLKESSTPVTQEQKDAIAAILDYDTIIEKYNPELSDPVKETFNENAGSDALKEYFKVYISLFFKHPSHYIQATMNNYYYYYYPGSRFTHHYTYTSSSRFMEDANKRCEVLGMDFAYPKVLDKYRNKYESIMEGIARLPIIAALISSATYNWCLILIVFYCIKSKNKKAIAVTVPLCVQLLICMVGPTNGWHFRYMFSIAVCMPAVLILCLYFVHYQCHDSGVKRFFFGK